MWGEGGRGGIRIATGGAEREGSFLCLCFYVLFWKWLQYFRTPGQSLSIDGFVLIFKALYNFSPVNPCCLIFPQPAQLTLFCMTLLRAFTQMRFIETVRGLSYHSAFFLTALPYNCFPGGDGTLLKRELNKRQRKRSRKYGAKWRGIQNYCFFSVAVDGVCFTAVLSLNWVADCLCFIQIAGHRMYPQRTISSAQLQALWEWTRDTNSSTFAFWNISGNSEVSFSSCCIYWWDFVVGVWRFFW